MKISGLVTIYSGKPGPLELGTAETTLPKIHFRKCVESFEGGQTFEFESEDRDLQSLASRLIEARKSGGFIFWAIEWHLIDDSGTCVDRGLMTEDDFGRD